MASWYCLGPSGPQLGERLCSGTQVHYIPLYRQPYYRAEGHKPLPNAEAYYEKTLSLPMYVGLSDADVAQIAAAVKDVLAP